MLKQILDNIERGRKPTITQKEVDLLIKNEPSAEQVEIGCKEYHIYCIWGNPIWICITLDDNCYTYKFSEQIKGFDWICPSQDTVYYLVENEKEKQ